MSQHSAASGQFDRAVNPADGVGSLTNGPRTRPAHAEGRLVYNGADQDGQNGSPGLIHFGILCSWNTLVRRNTHEYRLHGHV